MLFWRLYDKLLFILKKEKKGRLKIKLNLFNDFGLNNDKLLPKPFFSVSLDRDISKWTTKI